MSEWPQSQVEFIAVWYHGSNSSVPYSEAEILKRVSMVFGWRFEKSDPKEIKLCRATDTDLGVDWGLLSISAKQFGIEAAGRTSGLRSGSTFLSFHPMVRQTVRG